jgi:NADPH:quinone reductase-like Zn-dependent oxidoreductase
VCALLILYGSVTDPGEGVPRTLFGIGTTVYLHGIAYAGFTGAIGYALLSIDRRALLVAAGLATLYGAGIELLQGFLSYRSMEALDVLVNGAASLVGAFLWRALAPWFGLERSSSSNDLSAIPFGDPPD